MVPAPFEFGANERKLSRRVKSDRTCHPASLANMRISARNALPGKIVDIKKGATTAHVRIDVNGTIVTASITNEAVDDLGLKVGDKVHAVIKASDVMVAIP